MKTSVIGLGKLGGPTAGVLACKRHTVIGVQKSLAFVTGLNAGKAPQGQTCAWIEDPARMKLVTGAAWRPAGGP